jgi:hypothetical protein
MAQQIEPIVIWVNGEEKKGEYLKLHSLFPFNSNKLKAEIADADGNVLFERIINATNLEDAAYQLGLTIIK